MIEHYNAFISYRHAELDSKIAQHVQRSLERFSIPDKIKKQTGMKGIQRGREILYVRRQLYNYIMKHKKKS